MSRRSRGARIIGVVFASVCFALVGCEAKDTGPDPVAAPEAPRTATPVPATVTDPAPTRALASLAGRDDNRDGRLSAAEFSAAEAALFAAIDANRDGGLTVPELDAARQASGFGGGASSERIIAHSDSDGDRRLTLGEYVASANGRFTELDRNRDNFVDQAEWDAQHSTAGAASQP